MTAGAPVETPVPLSAADCAAVAVVPPETFSEAVRAPVASGLNVTVSEHDAPAARFTGQLLVAGKSPGLAPLYEMNSLSEAEPLLEIFTVWPALEDNRFTLPNARDAGLTVNDKVPPEPLPESGTVCGEPVALSLTLSVAVRSPSAAGVKITEMVQFAPAVTLVPQLLVCEKSPGSAPVRETATEVRAAVP